MSNYFRYFMLFVNFVGVFSYNIKYTILENTYYVIICNLYEILIFIQSVLKYKLKIQRFKD